MATGIPKTHCASSLPSLRLDYRHKAPESEILQTHPAQVEIVTGFGSEQIAPNRLYFSENLGALAALRFDPTVYGRVKLIYIDPPFATKSVFQSRTLNHAYEDILHGEEFIEFLRKRLILLRELLAEDGSIYVHLDEKMIFHIKVIMDEIFGVGNYQNCITRKKCNPKNYTRKKYGNISDYILFYTKSDRYIWNKPLEEWTEARAKEYQYIEPKTGRRFMKVPIHAPGVRHGATGEPWRGKMPPPGKHWQFPPDKLDEFDARGDIFWSSNGNPRRKIYLDENAGIGVQNIWLDYKDAHNQNVKITGYPTEKNPDLLKRIIEASSNPGDTILDCFSGSGTTLAVADLLNRHWIGIDNSHEAIKTTLVRFARGTQAMGDFVNGNDRKAKPETPSLFSMEPEQKTASYYEPIANFNLYADPAMLSLLNDLTDLPVSSNELKMIEPEMPGKQDQLLETTVEYD